MKLLRGIKYIGLLSLIMSVLLSSDTVYAMIANRPTVVIKMANDTILVTDITITATGTPSGQPFTPIIIQYSYHPSRNVSHRITITKNY